MFPWRDRTGVLPIVWAATRIRRALHQLRVGDAKNQRSLYSQPEVVMGERSVAKRQDFAILAIHGRFGGWGGTPTPQSSPRSLRLKSADDSRSDRVF
jgi:hypothetical protein